MREYISILTKVQVSTLINTSQKKFKAIVEAAGFKLVDCQIIGADGSAGSKGTEATPVTPSKKAVATPRKTPAKKAATPKAKASGGRGKKRKVDEVNEEDQSVKGEKQVKGERGENDDDDVEMNGGDEKNGDCVRSTSVQVDYEEGGADEDED